MFKTLFFFYFLSCTCSALGQYNFSINGITTDALNNKKIYLTVWDLYSDHKYQHRDSTLIKNNSFSFSGAIKKLSENAKLSTNVPAGNFDFVVDTGMNKVTFSKLPPKTPFFKNILSNNEISGSESNRIRKQIDSLAIHFYRTKGKPSIRNKNLIELDSLSMRELKRQTLSLLARFPNTFYSLIYLYSMSYSLSLQELVNAYDLLSPTIKASDLGKELYENILFARGSAIGSKVRSIQAWMNTDSAFSSSSLEGRLYILAFGATWCKPCKEKLPFLLKIYRKYALQGLEVVYVNLDEMTTKWKDQVEKQHLPWINISEKVKWDESRISKQFNIKVIPTYVLIDKAGKIAYNDWLMKDEDSRMLEYYIQEALK